MSHTPIFTKMVNVNKLAKGFNEANTKSIDAIFSPIFFLPHNVFIL